MANGYVIDSNQLATLINAMPRPLSRVNKDFHDISIQGGGGGDRNRTFWHFILHLNNKYCPCLHV